jgi:hypothetical protein
MLNGGLEAFGKQPRTPRQPWISPASWSVVRLAAPLRRLRYLALDARNRVQLLRSWLGWRSQWHESFEPGHAPTPEVRVLAEKGWRALAVLPTVRTLCAHMRRMVAAVLRAIALLHVVIVRCTRLDRIDFIQDMA